MSAEEADLLRDISALSTVALDRIATGRTPEAAIRIARDGIMRMEQRLAGLDPRADPGIPAAFWRDVLCGHPEDPEAAWLSAPHAPVCHCGALLDLEDSVTIEDASGPVVPCQNCGCCLTIPPAPTHKPALIERLSRWGQEQGYGEVVLAQGVGDTYARFTRLALSGYGHTSNEALNNLADRAAREGWPDDRPEAGRQ